mmetsp:Transcript_15001/g.23230  ORF Transcript_15001/g.23230 Transcript_15001/m.23230 type:complete len:82 (+) Transcript_15001:37-282(+)
MDRLFVIIAALLATASATTLEVDEVTVAVGKYVDVFFDSLNVSTNLTEKCIDEACEHENYTCALVDLDITEYLPTVDKQIA